MAFPRRMFVVSCWTDQTSRLHPTVHKGYSRDEDDGKAAAM
jgi:hypothetical protein